MAKQWLACACCGGDAGRFNQWHNQDRGFGLCGSCADWIGGRGTMTPAEMDRTYGKVGVNRPAPVAKPILGK